MRWSNIVEDSAIVGKQRKQDSAMTWDWRAWCEEWRDLIVGLWLEFGRVPDPLDAPEPPTMPLTAAVPDKMNSKQG